MFRWRTPTGCTCGCAWFRSSTPTSILSQLTLEQPVVHIIVNPRWRRPMCPSRRSRRAATRSSNCLTSPLGRVELRNGILLLNEQRLPFDFKANDVGLTMNYQRLLRRYDGTLHVGKMDAQYQDLPRRRRPAADAEFSLWRNRAQVKSLKLTSQRSSVELSGTIDDFNHPRLQFTYGGHD